MATIIRLLTRTGRLTGRYMRAGLHRILLKIGWRAGPKRCCQTKTPNSRSFRSLLAVFLLVTVLSFLVLSSFSPDLPYVTDPYKYPRSGRTKQLQKLHLEEMDDQRGTKVRMFAFKPDPVDADADMKSSPIVPGHVLDPAVKKEGGTGRGQLTEHPHDPAGLKETQEEGSRGPAPPRGADESRDLIDRQFRRRQEFENLREMGEEMDRELRKLVPLGDVEEGVEKLERHQEGPVLPKHLGKAGETMGIRPREHALGGYAGEPDKGQPHEPLLHEDPDTASNLHPDAAGKMSGRRPDMHEGDSIGEKKLRPPNPIPLEHPVLDSKMKGLHRPTAVEDLDKTKQTKGKRHQGHKDGDNGRKQVRRRPQRARLAEDPGKAGQTRNRGPPRRADGARMRGRPERSAEDPEDGGLGQRPSGRLLAEDAGGLAHHPGQEILQAGAGVSRDDDGLLYLLQTETRPPRTALNQTQTHNSQCPPHHHVYFAKVHKAGSSTVANILQRFGFPRGLNFVLPRKQMHSASYNYLSFPGQTLTRHDLIPPPRGEAYDMLWSHAIYSREFFRPLMPKDTIYSAILRHPLTQFVSTMEFYSRAVGDKLNLFMRMNVSNPMSLYLQDPSKFSWLGGSLSYTRNKQAQDLGMTVAHLNNATLRHQYIHQLDKDFHWVMITEFFDESLVMLKRLLCWEIRDIIYIPKNRTPDKKKWKFTPEDKESHKRLNVADYDLYNFFVKRLKNTLKAQPVGFHKEVTYFKALVEAVQWHCARYGKGMSMVVSKSQWNPQFMVENKDCRMMQKHELVFMDILFVDAIRRIVRTLVCLSFH